MSERVEAAGAAAERARALERLDGRLGAARLQLREAEVRHQGQQLARRFGLGAEARHRRPQHVGRLREQSLVLEHLREREWPAGRIGLPPR